MSTSAVAAPPRIYTPTRILALCAVTIILLIPVAVAVHEGAYDSFVDSALSGWGMWGTFAIYLWTRPTRKEAGLTVILGLAMRAAYDVFVGEKGYQGSLVIGMGTFLGLAGLIVLGVRALQAPDERRAVIRKSLTVVGLLNYIGICLGFYLPFARMVLPRKLDYYLYGFDGALGFQPSFAAGQWLQHSFALQWVEVMVYNSLGFWFAVIYAAHLNAKTRYPFNILKLFVMNAFIGFSLYFLFPAMGPKYAFPSYPQLPASTPQGSVLLSGIPNAMPSLHFGGSLLIFWMARPWRWLRVLTGVFCALTALATIGLGEHYLIDLVVAVPYSLAILALSSEIPQRGKTLVAASGLVLAWVGLLRLGAPPAPIAWTLVLATVAAGFLLEQRLARKIWV